MIIKFKKSNKVGSGAYMSNSGSGGSNIDPSTLKFVPYNPDNETVWDVPDRAVNVMGLTSTGDIVAKKTGAVIFAELNTLQETPAVTSIYQMEDVEALKPRHGDTLVYDAAKGMYVSDNTLMREIEELKRKLEILINGNNIRE